MSGNFEANKYTNRALYLLGKADFLTRLVDNGGCSVFWVPICRGRYRLHRYDISIGDDRELLLNSLFGSRRRLSVQATKFTRCLPVVFAKMLPQM